MASSPDSTARVATLRDRYAKGTRQLGVCVDRIDYTKGIPERIRALDTLWKESPELRERFTFIFVCTPSRTDLPAYNALERDVIQSIIATNAKYGTPDWTPIVLINENVDADLLAARLSRGRHVHRVVVAGRNESRRQGVRRLPDRRTRSAHPQPLHRIRRGDRRRDVDQSVQRGWIRRGDSHGARDVARRTASDACIACVAS